MSTLLRSAALILCAGVSYAHASEPAPHWNFNIGAMYEIENVEGQGMIKTDYMNPPCGLTPHGMRGRFPLPCIRKAPLITAV